MMKYWFGRISRRGTPLSSQGWLVPGFDDYFVVFFIANPKKITGNGPDIAPFIVTSCPDDFCFRICTEKKEIHFIDPKAIRRGLRGGMSRPLPDSTQSLAKGDAGKLSFRKIEGPDLEVFDPDEVQKFRKTVRSKGYQWAAQLGGSPAIYEDGALAGDMEFVGCINPGNLIDSLDQVAYALFWDGSDLFEQRLLFEM